MTLRLLPAARHRRMPWKNGRGETVEIAVYPQGAGLGDFGWRLSMAGVTEDGDFSVFQGIDRSLAILSGDGIVLDVAGQPHHLTMDAAPLAFPADAPASARLISGPVTDLNLMTRRGAYAHRLYRATDAAPETAPETAPVTPPMSAPDWRIILATAPATFRIDGQVVTLGPLDALLCEGAGACAPLAPDQAPDQAANLWLAEISRL